MCIIMHKPEGAKLPKKWRRIVKRMFIGNPDGAGIMYSDGEYIQYEKGFFKVKDLISAINKIPDRQSRSLAVHCRITTSGLTDTGRCHPFEITGNIKDMTKKAGRAKAVLMHNGIFTEYEGTAKSSFSDSMYFAQSLADFSITDLCENPGLKKLMSIAIDPSRVLIYTPKTHLFFGDWIQDHGDLWFSNNGYKKPKITVYSDNWRQAASSYMGTTSSIWPEDYYDEIGDQRCDICATWEDTEKIVEVDTYTGKTKHVCEYCYLAMSNDPDIEEAFLCEETTKFNELFWKGV